MVKESPERGSIPLIVQSGVFDANKEVSARLKPNGDTDWCHVYGFGPMRNSADRSWTKHALWHLGHDLIKGFKAARNSTGMRMKSSMAS